jgi:hypothetical protein
MIHYKVIEFGETNDELWNKPTEHLSLSRAQRCYAESLSDPETLGAVLVEIGPEDWTVRNSNGFDNYCLNVSRTGFISVRKLKSNDSWLD